MGLRASILAFSLALLTSTTAGAAPPRELKATPRVAVGVEATVDLGSKQQFSITKEGWIYLDKEPLVHAGGLDPSPTHFAHRLTRDQVTVVLGYRIPHMQPDPDGIVVAQIDLLNDRLLWSASVNAPVTSRAYGDWQAVFADRLLLVQRPDVLTAVDLRTGTQAWSFADADPSFDDDYHGELGIADPELEILSTRVRGRVVVVEGKRKYNNESFVVELDLDTGRRVYVDTVRKPAPAVPLFSFSRGRITVYHDDPPPPPPPPPPGYDGVMLGSTILAWNVETARGIIVNPTADALGDILELARKQTVLAADGTPKPIVWTQVIDTAALGTQIATGKLAKGYKPVARPKIVFSYAEGLDESGERIAADALADALGIPAIRNRVDLYQLADGVKVGQEQYGDVIVSWGPLGFHDGTHRWVERHVWRP